MPRLFTMPEVATGSDSSTLSTWALPEGSTFAQDDVLATVETDKAVVDITADAPGVLIKTLVAAETEAAVGAPIALLGDVGESIPDVAAALSALGVDPDSPEGPVIPEPPADQTSAEDDPGTRPEGEQDESAATEPARGTSQRVFASPLARRLASEAGLDVADIPGSGPKGRVRKTDVIAAIAAKESTPSAPDVEEQVEQPATTTGSQQTEEVAHSRVRRTIARRLLESKQTVPHFYLRGSARVDPLLRLRAELNADGAHRISVNDLILKAVARALIEVPQMNVTWGESAVTRYSSADVAVAVSTDDGLVTPVLRALERMPISEVSSTVKDYAARAKTGALRQSELDGGSFTVSNLGMFGTEEFIGIINPPHAGLLAVGAARPEPVVGADGAIETATVLRVTLSADHRPVDGVTAAQWMQAFVALLENPIRILV